MPSVGSYLRELRQRRGVALDEISRSTRVPQRYLESLEVDDFATLPEAPFTRGFIRAYCQALHEPPDEALAYYEADRGGQLSPRVAQPPAAAPRASQSRSESSSRRENRGRGALLVSFVMLVALGAALFAVTLALQPGGERRTERRTSESPGALSESEAPRPSVAAETPRTQDTAPPAPTPAVSAPTPPAPAAAAPTAVTGVASSYRLVARTSELTWIRVRTEDGRMSEENIPAGEIREWISNRPFVLSIGNAGGVTLEVNGRRLPPLGPSGAVIARLVVPAEDQ
ncbi:MAG: hypothetical protein DME11_03860 [Candidatus Rokuibacteriota bacterium]|nr:MAG: hypothetical protein DME11_03860 [Candidatus Rokubacteria bacterium]PYN67477.1 MAG: hypothetical protein DMD93_14405 [Candidatus Rokubacteria bacterium]